MIYESNSINYADLFFGNCVIWVNLQVLRHNDYCYGVKLSLSLEQCYNWQGKLDMKIALHRHDQCVLCVCICVFVFVFEDLPIPGLIPVLMSLSGAILYWLATSRCTAPCSKKYSFLAIFIIYFFRIFVFVGNLVYGHLLCVMPGSDNQVKKYMLMLP